jgi:molybdopterin/thiamine biosynthesis adenylyltransferase
MNDLRFVRQQDAVNMKRLTALGITIIGLGAIGSTCAVWLGKMGCVGLTCYDPDVIQDHNWSNQMYRDGDIGSLKASALIDVMEQFGGHTPNAIAQRYADQLLPEVVISAVDSMESRMTIWRSVREKAEVRLLLDARMGLETLMVYAIRPQVREDRVAYSQSLVPDDQALQEPCTARSICYTPLMASSILCSLVKRFVNDEEMPRRIVLDLATFTLMVESR